LKISIPELEVIQKSSSGSSGQYKYTIRAEHPQRWNSNHPTETSPPQRVFNEVEVLVLAYDGSVVYRTPLGDIAEGQVVEKEIIHDKAIKQGETRAQFPYLVTGLSSGVATPEDCRADVPTVNVKYYAGFDGENHIWSNIANKSLQDIPDKSYFHVAHWSSFLIDQGLNPGNSIDEAGSLDSSYLLTEPFENTFSGVKEIPNVGYGSRLHLAKASYEWELPEVCLDQIPAPFVAEIRKGDDTTNLDDWSETYYIDINRLEGNKLPISGEFEISRFEDILNYDGSNQKVTSTTTKYYSSHKGGLRIQSLEYYKDINYKVNDSYIVQSLSSITAGKKHDF
jgi:hypothetical protein